MASKLLNLGSHDAENLLELSLRKAFEELQPKLRPPFPLSIPTPQEYSQLNHAILHGVLTEPLFAETHLKHLHGIVSDGYALFVNLLVRLVNDLYVKLFDSVKLQLIWVVKEVVDVLGVGFDSLLVCLLRRISGGDFSDGNLWLCFELVNVFLSRWDCLLEEEPSILCSGLYVYLRVLADHCRISGDAKLESLRRLEIEFCVRMLREQFHLCLKIGRDLVRLLQDLFHVPEFRAVLKDLVLSPGEFRTPGFSGLSQLYCTRTSSRYFLLRISPEMEAQLRFLMMHVKFGNQRRYQAWFARKFLSGPEKETIIIDIVRFICCAHHPTNETIQSDIIPRWAVIGWLLKVCKRRHIEANVKLALLYDWLFFDERVDNIMNIEPAMLLMVFSIPKYIDMTHSLLEFLLLLADNYDVEHKQVILKGLSSALHSLIQKGVIPSLDVLTSCSALSPLLKERFEKLLLSFNVGIPSELQLVHHPHSSKAQLRLHNMSCSATPTPSPEHDPVFQKGPRLSTNVVDTPGAPFLPSSCPLAIASGGEVDSTHHPHSSKAQLKLHNMFCLATPTPSLERVPVFQEGPRLSTNAVDTPGAPLLPSSSPLAIASRGEVDGIDSLLKRLPDAMKKSIGEGLQVLEAILRLFVNLDNQDPLSSSLSPDILALRIANQLESVGHKLFTPLEFNARVPCSDNELRSVTALINRSFVLSQHERIQKMLLFWARNGFPVGGHLLSYASRLAYESHEAGTSEVAMLGSTDVKVNDLHMSLLIFHVDGFLSSLNDRKDDFSKAVVSDSKIDRKCVDELVGNAFAAYRCFLLHSKLNLHKDDDMSLSQLLLLDIILCSQWQEKKLKYFFCSVFYHLAEICMCNKDIIKFMLIRLDHIDILHMQFEIALRRFSIFGENTEEILNLVKDSFCWDPLEQYKLWGLIRSELSVSSSHVEKLILEFFYSGELGMDSSAIGAGGLLALCNCCAPTPELVGAIMLLPDKIFQDFASTVLATWVVSNSSLLFDSLAKFSEKLDKKNGDAVPMNHSAVLWLMNYFSAHGISASSVLTNLTEDTSARKPT